MKSQDLVSTRMLERSRVGLGWLEVDISLDNAACRVRSMAEEDRGAAPGGGRIIRTML